MIKEKKVLILLLLVSWGNAFSQQLSHQVLVSVAGITSTTSINYSQTIGETAVEIIGCTEYTFTQGFQQPGIKFSKENPPPGNGVKVYPNPISDFVNVELFGSASRAFRIDIINISGTIVRTEKIDFTGPYWHVQQFAFDELSRGLYFVRIVSDDGLISRTFKIDKM
jgi:hypothetical protein